MTATRKIIITTAATRLKIAGSLQHALPAAILNRDDHKETDGQKASITISHGLFPGMKQHVHQMLRAGVQAEQLAVRFMRQPGEPVLHHEVFRDIAGSPKKYSRDARPADKPAP